MTLDTVQARPSTAVRPATVLQVGGGAALSLRLRGHYAQVRTCRLNDLDAALSLQPDAVATPWRDDGCDCLDVAAALTAQDWDGVMLIAATSVLPRPEIVLVEISDHAPFLEVALLPD